MNNKKVAILSFLLIGAFALSTIGNVAIIAPTAGQTVTNFSLVVETNTGNRRREAFALYLKQALAPFGIDVTVLGKPFNQFVGDLLHFTGETWDIAIVGFVGGSPFAPSFVDLYACDGGFFGPLTYQVCEDSWNETLVQTSTAQGHTLTQGMVDDLLWKMELEFNIPKRKAMTDTFQEWFMTQLLYDYPLLAPVGLQGIWKGLVDYDPLTGQTGDYDANEGMVGTTFRGGYWDYENYPTLKERQNDAETIAYTIGTIDPNFDPLQGASSSQSAAKAYLFPTLVMFDKNYKQHPNVALTYNLEDWTGAPVLNESACGGDNIATCEPLDGTQTIPYGHISYTLRDDVYWITTEGGPQKTTHKVTAKDFWFTFQLYRSPNILINGQSSFQNVYNVTYDEATNRVDLYVYKPTIDDLFFGSYQAVPSWLLGGDLTLENGSKFRVLEIDPDGPDGNAYLNTTELYDEGITAFDSVEWNAFEKNPVQAGPYYVDFTDNTMYKDGEFLNKKANPFFWFPTETDSPGSDFILNEPGPEDPYYFAYNGSNKVTELRIKKLIHPIIDDLTVDLLLFKTGKVDSNAPDFFGGAEIEAQKVDNRFGVYSYATTATADLLMFNILNENLKKYNVRRAIASAVDKEALGAIVDNLRAPQDSPVKLLFLDWYKDDWKIPYDPAEAAALLRGEGYVIPDTSAVPVGDGGTVFSTLIQAGDELLMFLTAFVTVFSAMAVKKKRKF